MNSILKGIMVISIGVITFVGEAWSMTPQQLKDELTQAETTVTVIDVRSRAVYSQGHIQGALSIPASIIAKKHLPPMGRVVVYGQGLTPGETLEAVEKLNAKRGIEAEILVGGYAAWEAENLTTTREQGLGSKRVSYLSYSEFEKVVAENADLVIVDLRRAIKVSDTVSETISTLIPEGSNVPAAFTDLSVSYPGVRVIDVTPQLDEASRDADIASKVMSQGKGSDLNKLYVLIDNANGESERVADRLLSAGVNRVTILAGGEKVIGRSGLSGKQIKESRVRP